MTDGDFFLDVVRTRDPEKVRSYLACRPDTEVHKIKGSEMKYKSLTALELCVVGFDLDMTTFLLSLQTPVDSNTLGRALLSAAQLAYSDIAAPILQTLLKQGGIDSLRSLITKDEVVYVSKIAIYTCGGQNILHCAVEQSMKTDFVDLVQGVLLPHHHALLQDLLTMKDFDGMTPGDIARVRGLKHSLFPCIDDPSQQPTPKEATDAWQARRRKRLASLEAVKPTICPPLSKEEYVIAEPFRRFDRSCLSSVGSSLELPEIFQGQQVHVIQDVFTPEFLQLFNEEVIKIVQSVPPNRLRRPNSMNNYGFVLQDVGFRDWMYGLANEFLFPLAVRANIIDVTSTEMRRGITSFKSVHAFVIRYKVGEDLNLAEHTDNSDFTFNVCLGTEHFSGAALYFKARTRRPDGTWEIKQIHYYHKKGVAVIHRGHIQHGVDNLTDGERLNLVVWCKTAEYGYD